MSTSRTLAASIFTFFILLGGCGGNGEGSSGPGFGAPRIADLTIDRKTVTVGQPTSIRGQLTLRDSDGDIDLAVFRITRPSGKADPELANPTDDFMESREALADLQVPLTATEPGIHYLEIWVRDRAQHDSNHMNTTILAEDSEPACVPGAQIECACGSGTVGHQACAADGERYDPCICP